MKKKGATVINKNRGFRWLWLSVSLGALSTMFCVTPVIAGNGYQWGGGGGGYGGGSGGNGSSLTQMETGWLVQMRQEEKLARDVYRVMYQTWGAPVFSNIAASEQRHTDAVESLIDKYGITDPVTNENVPGDFADPAFNTLYNSLITRGLSSLQEAYRVGVDIEVLDISDLQEAMADTNRADIENVYGNLLDGSYNHLSAFKSMLR